MSSNTWSPSLLWWDCQEEKWVFPAKEGRENLEKFAQLKRDGFHENQDNTENMVHNQFVKEKQILQDILFNILLVNVLLYWIMGIKGMKDPYHIFEKQYF